MRQIHGLSHTRLPIHPHRRKDELFSSWFVRTAHDNHLKAQTFGSLVFGKRAFVWTRDIDRCATEGQLERLGLLTGSSMDELREGLLTAYEGVVFDRFNPNGNSNWILPSVFYVHRRVTHGMQFCPLCLFFDEKPYFRKQWRLAFATICDVHGTMLHDRCPECGAPVIFFRNDTGDVRDFRLGDLVSCWKCGFDLRRAPAFGPEGPDGKTIMALRSLVTFHDLGWWFQGGRTIPYSPLYFDVLRRLVAFLATRYGKRFRDEIEHQTGWRVEVERSPTHREFESKSVQVRHQFMMAILWLLDDWPDRFVGIAKRVGATQSEINDGVMYPHWFESVIRLNLGGGHYNLTAEEVTAAVAYLQRSNTPVTGVAIGNLLGRKDARVVRPHIRTPGARFSAVDVERLCEKFDAEHADAPPTCRFRLVWQRDRTILRLGQTTGRSFRWISRLKLSDVPSLPVEVSKLVAQYLEKTRPLMASDASGDALFIKWRGGVLVSTSWHCRAKFYSKTLKRMAEERSR